ncbi:MAG: NAD(+)/NADH kinase [Clostridia bacterium]|nr:NAD(+)/NADH kinase [Clostridia bacterium]
MKTIGIYPNPKRDAGLVCTRQVIEILLPYGASFLAPKHLEPLLEDVLPREAFVEEETLFTKSECLVTLGGDGTILSVAARAAEASLPILGINLGHVGFMAGLEKKDLQRIRGLMTGDFTLSSRMLLSCRLENGEEMLALNEFVIAPEKGFHIVELSLYTNERKLCDFRADGLIFNTPNGSTGYSFSAGGAVMDAEFDAVGVKAISSYLLIGAHHMIFSPETVFTVKNFRSEGSVVTVCADGREEKALTEGDEVTLRRSNKRVQLITFDPQSNHEVFFRKF